MKQYLRTNDIFIHSDVLNAAICIVRAKTTLELITPTISTDLSSNISSTGGNSLAVSLFAIQEAGIMTICRSNAWNSKILTSSYWVHANQVSKGSSDGQLNAGSYECLIVDSLLLMNVLCL